LEIVPDAARVAALRDNGRRRPALLMLQRTAPWRQPAGLIFPAWRRLLSPFRLNSP